MYRVVPQPVQLYNYDIGSDPGVDPVIFTIQNRTLNVPLLVQIILPSFLRITAEGLGPVAATPQNPFIIKFRRERHPMAL
jgi:hypothetical protein